MSELDLDLKLSARRLAWSQGAATRLNVPLRTAVDRQRAGSAFQEFTDLDVLATSMSRNSQVHLDIFDCKTSAARSTERMFWLAGVVELFKPDQAWLLREKGITEAARVLAARLHLGTLSRVDLEILLQIHGASTPGHTAIERLFDRSANEEYQGRLSQLDRKLRPLQDALRYNAWMVEPYRNLAMLPGVLTTADDLASDNPLHVSLLLDVAWLYLHALSYGVAYVASTGAHDLEARFSEFYLGGQTGTRDKEAVRDVFMRVTGNRDASLLPDYFPNLLEVFGRLFVSPLRITEGMRYIEVLAAGVIARRRPNLSDAFGPMFDPVTAKLTADVLNLLVGAAGLPPSFRSLFRTLLLGPAPDSGGVAKPSESVKCEGIEPPASTGAENPDASRPTAQGASADRPDKDVTLELEFPGTD